MARWRGGGGDLKLETIDTILDSLDLGGLGYAFLVDDNGTVLVHSDREQVLKGLGDLFPGGKAHAQHCPARGAGGRWCGAYGHLYSGARPARGALVCRPVGRQEKAYARRRSSVCRR